MNTKKIKLFLKLHWIKLLVFGFVAMMAISMIILITWGINTWRSIEAFYKRQQIASLPLQIYTTLLYAMISAPIFVFMWYWLLYRGGFAKLKKTPIKHRDSDIHWKDIIGMEEAKQEALEVVRLVKDRAELQRIGGQILRGILMLGPPGCGKTYLAKAIATESGLPFLSLSGSEFTEMFVGVGASRMRKLFKQARQFAYAEGGCIVFIDELDAVGARRALDVGFGGQQERNTTLNQLLIEMDGLKEKEFNIVIIGATNAPENYLDSALLRPGRFDRKIYVDLPNLDDREKLFAYYLNKVKYDPALAIGRLARMAVYKTPADIANIVREASLIAVRNRKERIELKEISEAMDRIEMGIKHRRIFTEREKQMVAYHEAGHALVMYILHPTDDVFKASIASRGYALGHVIHQPREELLTSNRERIFANIKVALGGYVAEKLKFGTTSDGVGSDFRNAMQQAHNMVWRFGMGGKGYLGDYTAIPEMQLSEKLKEELNFDTTQLFQIALNEVEELLKKEFSLLEKFAQELLMKEELDYDEIERIFKEYGHQKSPPDSSPNP